MDRHEVEGRGEVGNKAPAIETERDYFLLGVSSTTEVTENIEQAIKTEITPTTNQQLFVTEGNRAVLGLQA
jgi:hypothetical protein